MKLSQNADAFKLLNDIMEKGLKVKYDEPTVALATKLYAKWSSFFEATSRTYVGLSPKLKAAWCEVALMSMAEILPTRPPP